MKFEDEQNCIAYLESMRWPDGVRCLKCNGDGISRFQAKGKTGKVRHLYQCVACRYQFSVTTGSIFHDSHLPLSKWFQAIGLVHESGEGISTNQLGRALGVQYKTAGHVLSRIREIVQGASEETRTGVPEAEGTKSGERLEMCRERQPWEERAFMGLVGSGKLRESKPIAKPAALPEKIRRRPTPTPMAPGAVPLTTHPAAMGDIWSIFKRGITGNFPMASVRCLPGYMNDLARAFGGSIVSALPTSVPKGIVHTLARELKDALAESSAPSGGVKGCGAVPGSSKAT